MGSIHSTAILLHTIPTRADPILVAYFLIFHRHYYHLYLIHFAQLLSAPKYLKDMQNFACFCLVFNKFVIANKSAANWPF